MDFEIEEQDGGWIWLEVKNWEPTDLEPHRRGGQRWSFLCKMRSRTTGKEKKKRRSYFQDLREKFLGASAFLSLTKSHPQTHITFIILIESPKLSNELLLHAGARMKELIPVRRNKTTKWEIGIEVAVMNVAEWNRRFVEYPARII